MNFKLIVRRFLAFMIDWCILLGGAMALMFFGPGSTPDALINPSIKMFLSTGFLIGLAWLVLYGLFKDCLFGRKSLGKLICGLKIVDSNTQANASFACLILRNVTYVIVQIEAIIVLVNNGKRIGDMLAKTQVELRSR